MLFAMLLSRLSVVASITAKDLGEALNLQYNKSRQSRITTEISEISAGAEALQ
jgi:F0F1-type ATP synthase gamma subunit